MELGASAARTRGRTAQERVALGNRASRAAQPWRDTAIRGHFARGIGILVNEAYIGRRVGNRQRFL